jgi:hypothetical protein
LYNIKLCLLNNADFTACSGYNNLYQGKSGFFLVCAMPTEFGQMYQYCIYRFMLRLYGGRDIFNALCSVCVWINVRNLLDKG